MQDGNGYILIDVPDENFTEAYRMFPTSPGFSCSSSCNSIAYHHLCLRASMKVFCAVADHVKSHSMQEGSGCYSSIAEDQSMSCWSAVDALKERVDLKSISNLVITHLTPKRLPSLKAFLQERAGQGSLSIHLSNPALQLLRSTFGERCCCHPDCQVDLPS